MDSYEGTKRYGKVSHIVLRNKKQEVVVSHDCPCLEVHGTYMKKAKAG